MEEGEEGEGCNWIGEEVEEGEGIGGRGDGAGERCGRW